MGTGKSNAISGTERPVIQAITLGYVYPSAQAIVITEASPVGQGTVLVQKQGSDC